MTTGAVIGGKYRLVRVLGQGGMGQVWAAINELTGGEVALKLVPESSDELRQRLMREARACGRIRHRNVIEIHDVGQTDEGEPFLVMQLLQGETLQERLRAAKRIEQAEAARIGRDVARALGAAHKTGVVHRDLKPANVFLHQEEGADGDYVVKVLDFGVSKNLVASDGLETAAGRVVGSPAYMSPEQIRGQVALDGRSDVWSLGVVLFEMLAGKRPFIGGSGNVMARILNDNPPPLEQLVQGVDPAFNEVILRCMRRDRTQRYGSADEVAAELQRFVAPPRNALFVLGRAPAAPSPAAHPVAPAPAPRRVWDDAEPPTALLQRDAGGPGDAPRAGAVPAGALRTMVMAPDAPVPSPAAAAHPLPAPARAGPVIDATEPLVARSVVDAALRQADARAAARSETQSQVTASAPRRGPRLLPWLVVLAVAAIGLLVALTFVILGR